MIELEHVKLPGEWSLRKLGDNPSRWALQYMGMDYFKISDFLPPTVPGRSTLDEKMLEFGAAMRADGEAQPGSSDV